MYVTRSYFEKLYNNFQCRLAEAHDPTSGSNYLVIRPEDIPKFGFLTGNPFAADYFVVAIFTLIHPAALDADGKIILDAFDRIADPDKVKIFAINHVYPAAASPVGKDVIQSEEVVSTPFPVGSLIRCNLTANTFDTIYTTLADHERKLFFNLTNRNDADVPLGNDVDQINGTNTIYFSYDHLDANGSPKLCRKDYLGNVTVIG